MFLTSIYYMVKPLLPRKFQIFLRRRVVEQQWNIHYHHWPIDYNANRPLNAYYSWPDGKRFAFVLTHDVEKSGGQDKCGYLSQIEQELGFRSCFNFVPERYTVSPVLRHYLIEHGFEVGVHDLNHDGKLFSSYKKFSSRVNRINSYLQDWKSVGFRAGAMHHNLEWIGELQVEYDMSTFDTDPFEPQPDGVETIFPFIVNTKNRTYVELPYTVPQDYTLFILLREPSIAIWKYKIDWIVHNGGMVLVNTHPDYMCFGKNKPAYEEYPVARYVELLKYVHSKYGGEFWNGLPKDIAAYWNQSKQVSTLENNYKKLTSIRSF